MNNKTNKYKALFYCKKALACLICGDKCFNVTMFRKGDAYTAMQYCNSICPLKGINCSNRTEIINAMIYVNNYVLNRSSVDLKKLQDEIRKNQILITKLTLSC
jgi:hypothetical protein